jgi:hypothetical protein
MFNSPSRSIGDLIIIVLCAIAFDGCASNSSHTPEYFSIKYDSSLSRSNLVLIIPGLHQVCSDPGYDSIGAFYKTKGITPVYVTINWRAVGFNKLSAAALKISDMLKDSFPQSNVYLFGFSFGAVICLKVSQSTRVNHLLLCSMSPLFAEDRVHQIVPFRQIMGMVIDYSSSGLSYSSSRETCLEFLYGDHDSFVINKAIIKSRKAFFTCNETRMVSNARHDISGKSYLEAIKQVVQRIGK